MTLTFLKRMGIPMSRVRIYVSDHSQKWAYEEILGPSIDLVVGGPTLRDKRNHILLEASQGQKILCFDDDVKNIIVKNPGSTMADARKDQGHWITPQEFHDMVVQGFQECERHGAHLWGVQATNNPAFCKDKVSVGLKFICGAMYGQIVRDTSQILTSYNFKEDFERTMRHYMLDGCVVRLEKFGLDTVYFSKSGGTASQGYQKRFELMNHEIDLLIHEFPGICKAIQKRHYRDLKLANLKKLL